MQRLHLFVNWHNCHSWKVTSGIIYFRRIPAVKPWLGVQLGNPKHKINHAVIRYLGLHWHGSCELGMGIHGHMFNFEQVLSQQYRDIALKIPNPTAVLRGGVRVQSRRTAA